ncbi:hypothetical protein ACFQVA_16215 [Actinomadura keratinilytica]
MSARYDRARTCKLVWEDRDTGEIGRVETGGLSACTDDIKAATRPSSWSTRPAGSSPAWRPT